MRRVLYCMPRSHRTDDAAYRVCLTGSDPHVFTGVDHRGDTSLTIFGPGDIITNVLLIFDVQSLGMVAFKQCASCSQPMFCHFVATLFT